MRWIWALVVGGLTWALVVRVWLHLEVGLWIERVKLWGRRRGWLVRLIRKVEELVRGVRKWGGMSRGMR